MSADQLIINVLAEFPRSENRGVCVHIESNKEVRDQTEFHDCSSLASQMKRVGGRLAVAVQYYKAHYYFKLTEVFVTPISEEY